jgi:hypothetical protein
LFFFISSCSDNVLLAVLSPNVRGQGCRRTRILLHRAHRVAYCADGEEDEVTLREPSERLKLDPVMDCETKQNAGVSEV